MAPRKRLSRDARRAIVRQRREGRPLKALAAEFGVTERTIHYTLRADRERRRDAGVRTKTISVTLTPEELLAFDSLLARQGIGSRSEALRRLIQAATGIFVPDERLARELQDFRAALNRVGNDVTQIARRLNEARLRGVAPTLGGGSLAQLQALAGFVLDFADEVDLLVRRRTAHLTLTAGAALQEVADAPE